MTWSRGRGRTLFVLAVSICLLSTLSQAALAKPAKGDPSLRGAWLFDEGTGSIAYDRSIYDNDGAITGATWVRGRIGSALAFDGLSDRVVVPASAALEPEHLSLALWFRTSTSPGRWRVLAFKGVTDCLHSSYALKANEAGTGIVFMVYTGTGDPHTLPATGVWDGQWHHVVGTYDGDALRLYLDGTLVDATGPMNGQKIKYGLANGDYFAVGHPVNLCGDYNPQFTGDIDEVQIWDRALTEAEILKLASAGTKPGKGRK